MSAINRKDYRTEADYKLALEDEITINNIKKKYNLNNANDVKSLYKEIINGNIKFHSKVGREFDDEIYEIYKSKCLSNNNIKDKKSSSKKADNKKTNNKKNINKKTESKNVVNKNDKKIKSLDELPDSMRASVVKELRKKEIRRKIFLFLFLVIMISSTAYYIMYYRDADKSEKRFNELADYKNSVDDSKDSKTTVKAKLSNDETVELKVLSKYEKLYNSNKKLIGWLQIADTNIDYPVMQCDNNEYYLNHNFDQEEDKVGALFLDCNCDVINGSDNYIIYGHHLSSGKMFSHLSDYQSEKFYLTHKYITFDTIYETQKFQVMYAFRSRVYSKDDVNFKYYEFIKANSEEEFNSYMQEMDKESFYDTGVKAYYGDTLLTLSTCDYNEKNGRFVVVAKRIY